MKVQQRKLKQFARQKQLKGYICNERRLNKYKLQDMQSWVNMKAT